MISRLCTFVTSAVGLLRLQQVKYLCVALLTSVSLLPSVAAADPPANQNQKTDASRSIREYRSSRLHVRTDLPPTEAESLYKRLEDTLVFASHYWGRKPKGQIKCFVVDDLDAWSDAQLPHRLSRVIIRGVGGATIPKIIGSGKLARNVPVVYASSRRGVAEHELIHAYCIHTFGSSGPEWYKEGMAEMVVSRSTQETGLQCTPEQILTLRTSSDTSLAAIFKTGDTGNKIFASLKRMMNDPTKKGQHISTASWTDVDSDNVTRARDEYLHSWAFCYMMLHNPNYSRRFRNLGNTLIVEQHDAFDDFFGAVRENIEFEHQQLLKHASVGYRVDLCAWDWNHRFKKLNANQSHRTRVVANKGFQPSGITVTTGQSYNYVASGSWRLAADCDPTDADGDDDTTGQLIGVIMTGHDLSDPFPLGTRGSWKAVTSGKLYLRCNDAWNSIADNTGQMTVNITAN